MPPAFSCNCRLPDPVPLQMQLPEPRSHMFNKILTDGIEPDHAVGARLPLWIARATQKIPKGDAAIRATSSLHIVFAVPAQRLRFGFLKLLSTQ